MAGLAGLALAGGCSTSGGGRDGPQAASELRIWVPPLVHWAAGGDRHVDVAVENGTFRTIALAEPDPAAARVAVFPGADNLRVCGVDFRPVAAGERRRIEIPPGGMLSFRVDLNEACAAVPAGEYRFEVDYRSPPVEGGKAFAGAFATRYGELVVEGGSAPAGKADPPARAGRTPPRRVPQRVNE
jgi:hypothetical protein